MSREINPVALSLSLLFCLAPVLHAQGVGGIRGVVLDKDFDKPLAGAQVLIVETAEKGTTDEEGHFVFGKVEPGTYTLVVSREGYARQVAPNVVVTAGGMTDVNASLAGEFTEMEEFVVQNLELGGTSEIGQMVLRQEAPAMITSVSADVMTKAGASDAASALRLVSGATVQDGKYAVVRGLPDRYVSSQLNGVRLPTADANRRAVQLDQFPAAMIESIQVSKTFTPEQQGDASGGAVNLVLKGIPDKPLLKFKFGVEGNTQVTGRDDFLTYEGGGVNLLGMHGGSRDIPADGQFGGTMGTERGDSMLGYNWSATAGGKRELASGVRIGAFGSTYYKRRNAFYDDGRNDTWVARLTGGRYTLQPYERYGYTSLYDVTEGVDGVQWGLLGAIGAEVENHSVSLLFMRTHVAEDKATLMEDVRGKLYADELDIEAPFHRSQTLDYTERLQSTVQLKGRHTLEIPEYRLGRSVQLLHPEIDWTLAQSSAGMDSPDKRVFSTWWQPARTIGGTVFPAVHSGYDPSGSGNGFAQRIWKDITEDSDQFFVNGKLPFKQWTDDEGYLKVGVFSDRTDRNYAQHSFFYDSAGSYEGEWDKNWSDVYVNEGHPLYPSTEDVDYTGHQVLSSEYSMVDLPIFSFLKVIGGVRYESTKLDIVNHPESSSARYLPPGGTGWTQFGPEADVSYAQDDILPSLGLEVAPIEKVHIRGSYSRTVARQTFKELSPVMQMEYLGADVFVGNPLLRMSALDNYDLRIDYEPYRGGLLSASWFQKGIDDPIEYVQRYQASLYYTTVINYPQGSLQGYELEARQDIGRLWSRLEGFSLGANATIINSEVTLPDDEAAAFDAVLAPRQSRDMMHAPYYLYNLNLTYDIQEYGTQIGAFYTVRGDTLVAGGYALGNSFWPDIYEKEYGTLNFSVLHPMGKHWKLTLAAKNLNNPKIQEVYRSDYIDQEQVRRSYRKGIDLTLHMEYEF